MTDNKQKIETKIVGDKLQVISSNIQLEKSDKDGKTDIVGMRTLIDEYPVDYKDKMVAELKLQFDDFTAKREEEIKLSLEEAKKFNKREEDQIKAQIKLREKEKAYVLVQQKKSLIENYDVAIEQLKKELEKYDI